MCNLYQMTPKGTAERAIGAVGRQLLGDDWEPRAVGPFQAGAFLVPAAGGDLRAVLGQWGMIRAGQPERVDYMKPKVPGKKGRPRSTNNARIEDVLNRPTFTPSWKAGRRCLVPAEWYAEPNWETKKNIWWHLRRADGIPWFIAGLWSEWTDPASGEIVPNFTMLTCNCTGHPLLGRLHKPETDEEGNELPADQQDKRSLIHIEAANWEQWLHGTAEEALKLIRPQPVEAFDQADAQRTDAALAGGQGGLF